MTNRCVVLARRPDGPVAAEDFHVVERPVPAPGPGQLLVRTLHLSLDPYMASAIQQRHPSGAVSPGEVMPGDTVGIVERSNHPRFAEGQLVLSRGGWQTLSIADGEEPPDGPGGLLSTAARAIDPPSGVSPSAYLGVLGTPGLTAYASLTRVLRPQPGETVAVFAAAGAVGSAAGQLARIMGSRAVAIVGSPEKARHARERLGFDAAVVRTSPSFADDLSEAATDGIDAVLANVTGGAFTDVLWRLTRGGRVALLGDMEQYNSRAPLPGPSLAPLLAARGTITGFVVYDHADLLERWRSLAVGWMRSGRLMGTEDRTAGLEYAPEAFERLMAGATVGKAVVGVSGTP